MKRESAIINLGNGHKAIVDIEDLPGLSKLRWFAGKRGNTYYAATSENNETLGKKIYMHHKVMGRSPAGMEIDHINGNGLDNRKENLRFCTHQQNLQARRKKNPNASSQYKGVHWSKDKKRWRTIIRRIDGKREHLGYFNSELDAAKAYDKAALEMFGEFAVVNFPKPAEEQDRLFPE